MLPLQRRLIQARWSGESAWIPLGELGLDLSTENVAGFPDAGELLLYPGGVSETEILIPYGNTCFACKSGRLVGNHFLTVIEGREHLPALGNLVLWSGAQNIRFEEVQGDASEAVCPGGWSSFSSAQACNGKRARQVPE